MKTKKATSGIVASLNKLQGTTYRKPVSLSTLKFEIGGLLLFGNTQQENFWRQFDLKLRQYVDLRMSGSVL